jgi:WD40 repeat protein
MNPAGGDGGGELWADPNKVINPLAGYGKIGLAAGRRQTGRAVREAVVGAAFESSWFSPDGSWYGAGGQDKKFTLWDLETGEATVAVTRSSNVLASSIAPDGQSFCVGTSDTIVEVFETRAGFASIWSTELKAQVCAAQFTPDSQYVATIDDKETVEVWDAKTGELHATLEWPGGTRWGGHALSMATGWLAISGDRGEMYSVGV